MRRGVWPLRAVLMTAANSVYDCIVAVANELAQTGVSKGRKNEQQGYQFRGIDDVLNALSPLLAKHQLVILPRVLSRTVVERASRNGGVLFFVTVECAFDFVSAADKSTHTVITYGEAMDSGDKATNKAMSAAYKYAAVQAFCIPVEGVALDADLTTHEPEPLSAAVRGLVLQAAVSEPAAAPATGNHPVGYVAWFQQLREAAMLGTAMLERAWLDAPKQFRQHLATVAPNAQGELKTIAARATHGTGNRNAGNGNGHGRTS